MTCNASLNASKKPAQPIPIATEAASDMPRQTHAKATQVENLACLVEKPDADLRGIAGYHARCAEARDNLRRDIAWTWLDHCMFRTRPRAEECTTREGATTRQSKRLRLDEAR
jgi:hypothetical protein